MQSHVMEVNVPRPSLVERALAPVHYADAFAVQFERGCYTNVDGLTRAVTQLPRAGMMLMAIRDAIVRIFGLKTVPDNPPSAPDAPILAGGVVGMLPIVRGQITAPPEVSATSLLQALDAALAATPGVELFCPGLLEEAAAHERVEEAARRFELLMEHL